MAVKIETEKKTDGPGPVIGAGTCGLPVKNPREFARHPNIDKRSGIVYTLSKHQLYTWRQ
jgi:hypothetical protein